ncbi:hypothetical protein HOG48_06410 [Candidatus Peregrinibacteria bacterium]|jgi:hypothetical protein|nr:hypothetical protein [Candidatus Peregrinibacteria bacterium]
MALTTPKRPPEEDQNRIIDQCQKLIGLEKVRVRGDKTENGMLICATRGPDRIWLSAHIFCSTTENARKLLARLRIQDKYVEKGDLQNEKEAIIHFTRKFVREFYGKFPLTNWDKRIRRISHSDNNEFPVYKYLFELLTIDVEPQDISSESSE